MTMSSTARKCVSSLLRASFARNFLEPTNRSIRNNAAATAASTIVGKTRHDAREAHSMAQTNLITSRDESRAMMALWPDVVRDLTDAGRHLDVPEATKWLAKVLQYNVPNGKKNRALTLVNAYRKLAPIEDLTEENIRLARILGWCVEMLQSFFLLLDDVMDRSEIRRGLPAWHMRNDLGLNAVNDGVLLEQATYQLLKRHFSGHPCYLDLVETFRENTLKTTLGQSLDMLATNFNKKPDLNLFTMNRYNSIVKYKTGYYSFVMPVQIAMHFAGIKDPEMYRQAKTILLEMGHFFQVQDDFLDCYGDPEVTGKQGTDIKEGKCSWLIVVALQRALPEQREMLQECYGENDPEKIAKVKQLYNDLGLHMTYSIYEEKNYNLINTHIQQISRGLPHDLFLKILQKIYRRDS